MNQPRLSKSRYISGMQCHLRLWYDTRARHLATPADDKLQAIFDTGHKVGELARKLYPGGHFVAHDHRHMREAMLETQQVIETQSAPVLFEAAFEHEHMLVRADVIERLPGGGWRLVEVKSTTRLKEVFVLDVAAQLWVLHGAGLDVREAGVLTLAHGYVRNDTPPDLGAMFELHPVFDKATALLDSVATQVHEMQAMLTRPAAPDIGPGAQCFAPYACPYYAHCTGSHASPGRGIDETP